MNTFVEMQAALQSDLTVGSESTFFDPTTIKLALNRAYIKIAGLYRWPETEDAKKTSTSNLQEYYDYPDNWRPDSVWKLSVGGIDYGDPLIFRDYLYEKENNLPAGLTKMWSNQWRRYFIYPTPTANGNNDISIWGQKVVTGMTLDADVTIFSYSMPEVNEALVLEAVAILRNKGGEIPAVQRRYITGSQLLSIEAKQIVAAAWGKIQEEQKKYESTTPMFEVPDFFLPAINPIKKRIGDF